MNMIMLNVNVVNKSMHRLPEYKHPGDAGMDLKANISTPMAIRPGENVLIPTGIFTSIPEGYYANIKSRSGLAAKAQLLATEGVIDSGYTGEWFVNLFNFHPTEVRIVNPGDRIAQAIFYKYETVNWNEVASLEQTDRGEGGFGSTGV